MQVPSSFASRAFLATVVVSVLGIAVAPRHARADDSMDRIQKLSAKAMESFDILDYENATKMLAAAVAAARAAGLEGDPAMARVYLNLGIVYFSGENDVDSARVAFVDAVRVDPRIEIDPAYKTADMQVLLDDVKRQVGQRAAPAAPGRDCSAVRGVEHKVVDTARAGVELRLEALLGPEVAAERVVLHYRARPTVGEAEPDYTEITMTSSDGCEHVAVIPDTRVALGVIHYYVAAYDGDGRVVASKGSSRAPNLIEVTPSGDAGVDENPLRASADTPDTSRFLVHVAVGSGAAYVSGATEQTMAPINCCVAPALLHVVPEIGYYIEPGMSLSVAMRLGFPIGANLPNHATAAPAGLVRLRKSLAPSGDGLYWSAAVGGGVIRQTIELVGSQNVDTSAIGPLLVGGGAGYVHGLSRAVRLVAELGMTLGIPVVRELGTARLNVGAQIDLSLGVMFTL